MSASKRGVREAPAPFTSESRPAVSPISFKRAEGPLMPFVDTYYLYRSDEPVVSGVARVDTGQIRFMMRGSGAISFAGEHGVHSEPSCPVMINGPNTAAAFYRVEGPFHCFGISLRPVGWRAMVGLPAHEVANHITDGVPLFGPGSLALLERLRELDTIEEMIAEVEPFLLARRRPVPKAHIAFARVVREWAASERPLIEALFAASDLSPRQVTRLCNEYFGGPPKHLERKFRAIGAAMRIYQGANPADVMGAFYDQAHMINEIRHFTGHTPTSLRTSIDPVLAATLENETFHSLPEVIPESVDERDH